jgi:hypothetical protein
VDIFGGGVFETILAVTLGVALSAAVGFRIFVPFLIVSIASMAGHIDLASDFAWIASWPALIAFSVATVIEIVAYFVPWLDNLLDIIVTPAAVVAGTIVTASFIIEMSPLMRWTLAIIAGGGAAGLVQVGTNVVRGVSTATTGGLTNPVVSAIETGSSIVLSILSVLVPVLSIVFILLTGYLVYRMIRYFKKRRARRAQLQH